MQKHLLTCKAICYSGNQRKLSSVSIAGSTASPGEQYCWSSSMSMYVYLNVYGLASVFHFMGTQPGSGCSVNKDILWVGLTPILLLEIQSWSYSCEAQPRTLPQAPFHLWSCGLSVQSPHLPHVSMSLSHYSHWMTDFTDWTVFPSRAGIKLVTTTLHSLPLDLFYHLWKFLSPSRIT